MKYFRLSKDPLQGLDLATAERVIEAIQERQPGQGRMEIQDPADTPDAYYIMAEGDGYQDTLVGYLDRRNIDYHVFDAPIGVASNMPDVAPTYGVVFILVTTPGTFPHERALAFLSRIAAVFAEEWNGGEPVLRTGMRRANAGMYWVGFNLVGAAQAFASRLKELGVGYQVSRTLEGARPELPLTTMDGAPLPPSDAESSPHQGRKLVLMGQSPQTRRADEQPHQEESGEEPQRPRGRRRLVGGAASWLGIGQQPEADTDS